MESSLGWESPTQPFPASELAGEGNRAHLMPAQDLTRAQPMDKRAVAKPTARGRTVLLLAGLVACSALAPSRSAGADQPCTTSESRTVFGRGDATVFAAPADGGNPNVLYACSLSANRPVSLRPVGGYGPLDDATTHFAAAGPYLAYVLSADDSGDTFFVGSVNLRTGRFARFATFHPRSGCVSAPVVKPNGSWAVIVDSFCEGAAATVHLADRRGFSVPAHGRGARDDSLKIRGSTVSWRQGRRAFSTHMS